MNKKSYIIYVKEDFENAYPLFVCLKESDAEEIVKTLESFTALKPKKPENDDPILIDLYRKETSSWLNSNPYKLQLNPEILYFWDNFQFYVSSPISLVE